jgi:hypothetical protein
LVVTNTFFGTAGDDFLTMGQNLWGHTIDMQGGTDTVTLLVPSRWARSQMRPGRGLGQGVG